MATRRWTVRSRLTGTRGALAGLRCKPPLLHWPPGGAQDGDASSVAALPGPEKIPALRPVSSGESQSDLTGFADLPHRHAVPNGGDQSTCLGVDQHVNQSNHLRRAVWLVGAANVRGQRRRFENRRLASSAALHTPQIHCAIDSIPRPGIPSMNRTLIAATAKLTGQSSRRCQRSRRWRPAPMTDFAVWLGLLVLPM